MLRLPFLRANYQLFIRKCRIRKVRVIIILFNILMLFSIKEKPSKSTQALNQAMSSADTQISVKKKLFSRKPSNVNVVTAVDKKRKVVDEFAIQFVYTQESLSLQQELCQKLYVNKTERYNQTSIRQNEEECKSLSKQRSQGICSNKLQSKIASRSCYYLNKNHNQQVEDVNSKKNSNTSKICSDIKKNGLKTQTINKARKNSTNNSCTDTSAHSLSQNFVIPQMSKSKEGSINKKADVSTQCHYCANNKKIADILNQKYVKLQEQYNQKQSDLKQLYQKSQKLCKQNIELRQQLQKYKQRFQFEQKQYLKSKQQLTLSIDSLKKDTVKLNQKLKYSQIQNSMLLRIKSEYLRISKQYDKMKNSYEASKIKISEARNFNNPVLSKNRLTKQPKNISKNDKIISRVNLTKKSIPLKKSHTKLQNPIQDCEDDNISLSFSQHSQDHT